MGWNRVWHGGALRLFEGIEDGTRFYFVHSYYPVVTDTTGEGDPAGARRGADTRAGLARAWCDYGVRFAAALETGRIFGTQFHPEKSQKAGIRLLENFAAIVKDGR
jgi:glutamine amidotransferase